MLLPVADNYNADETAQPQRQPDKVYGIDFGQKRLIGEMQGIDAVRQAAYAILNTERRMLPIYKDSYGIETIDLIGTEIDYACSMLKYRIAEALLYDDRITDVDKFEFCYDGKNLDVSFDVVSIYGNFGMEQRWRYA